MATIYWKYADLLADTQKRAQSVTTLGHTVDGSPIVVARGGGDKTPAIFITAGSHATEHAGVSSRCSLLTNSIRSTKSTSFQRAIPLRTTALPTR